MAFSLLYSMSSLIRSDSVFVGCLVIIFSVGIGPFTQQAVKTVPCNVAFTAANSSIQVANTNLLVNYPRTKPGYYDLDLESKAAILQGLANPSGNRSSLTADCSTGNCTFPSYGGVTHSSIAMCKRCVDVSHRLYEERTKGGSISIPNGSVAYNLFLPAHDPASPNTLRPRISVGGGQNSANITGFEPRILPQLFLNATAYPAPSSYGMELLTADADLDKPFLAGLRASVLNTSMITLSTDGCDWHPTPIPQSPGYYKYNITCSHPDLDVSPYWDKVNAVATACTFYPCVKDYYAVVNDTVFTETLVRETPIDRDPYDHTIFPNHQHFNEHCIINEQPVTLANVSSFNNHTALNTTFIDGKNVSVPHECFYHTGGIYLRALSTFLADALTGGCIMPLTTYFSADSGPRDWSTAECDAWWLQSLYNSGNATFNTIDANMEAVAIAITNEMRRQGSGWDGTPSYVHGSVSRATVCTQFDWKWLAFPFTLLLLTTLSLFITGIKTFTDKDEIPIWKSSALPLLFTGNGVGTTGASKSIDGVGREADLAVVRLVRGSDGWEFAGEQVGHDKADATASGNEASSTSSVRVRTVRNASED